MSATAKDVTTHTTTASPITDERKSGGEQKQALDLLTVNPHDKAAFAVVFDAKVGPGPHYPLKLLEAGSIFTSGFTEDGILRGNQLVEAMRGHLTAKFGLPQYSLEEILTSHMACLLPANTSLESSVVIQEMGKPKAEGEDKAKAETATYKCFHKRDYLKPEAGLHQTQVLRVDDVPAWRMVIQSKAFLQQMCRQAQVLEVRPKCESYSVRYDGDLAKRIRREIAASSGKYVLKTPVGSHGEGVFVVADKHLDLALKVLLEARFSKEAFDAACANYSRTVKDPNIAQDALKWIHQLRVSNEFVVEEYCPSLELTIKGKKYDPTMRVVGVVTVHQGKTEFHFLQACWKLPAYPIGKKSIRDGSISKNYASDPVAPEIQHALIQQLEKCLPPLFTQIFKFNIDSHIDELLRSGKKDIVESALILGLMHAEILNDLRRHEEARVFMLKLQQGILTSKNAELAFDYYVLMGESNLYLGKFLVSIGCFEQATKFAEAFPMKFHGGVVAKLYILRSKACEKASEKTSGVEQIELTACAQACMARARKCIGPRLTEKFFLEMITRVNYIINENEEIREARAILVAQRATSSPASKVDATAVAMAAAAASGVMTPSFAAGVGQMIKNPCPFGRKELDEFQRAVLSEMQDKLESYKDKSTGKLKPGFPQEGDLKVVIDLISSKDYKRDLPKALRNLCVHRYLDSACDLTGILLQKMTKTYGEAETTKIINDIPISADGRGRAALHHAADRGNVRLYKLLTSDPYKADPKLKEGNAPDGATPRALLEAALARARAADAAGKAKGSSPK